MDFKVLIGAVLISAWVTPALADEPDQRQATEEFVRMDREVTELAKQLGDWSEHNDIIADALAQMWKRNGWNSEADLYAKDLATDITEIPPWKFQDRMERFRELTRERYDMNDQQMTQFKGLLRREMFGMGMKYGPVLFKQAKEMLRTRIDGEAFTSEQVSRWAREFEPMMQQYSADISRITEQFGEIMTEEQRRIYDRDLESLNRRMEYVKQSLGSWQAGMWDPEDWGLQNDPVHIRARERLERRQALSVTSRALVYDPSTWERYVIAFIERFRLDEAQQKLCNNILGDLIAQAQRYRVVHRDEFESMSAAERREHQLLEPIQQMFAELKARLNNVPTESQLKAALQRRGLGQSAPR